MVITKIATCKNKIKNIQEIIIENNNNNINSNNINDIICKTFFKIM